MSEADRMFEELGYKRNDNDEYMAIIYDYIKNGIDKRIVFYLDIEAITTYSPNLLDDFKDCSIVINVQELKAINKKVEELGWMK